MSASVTGAVRPINKKLLAIIIPVAVAFLLALIPILIIVLSPEEYPDDTNNTGESFIGEYSMSVAVGYDKYIFKEGNKVVNKTQYADATQDNKLIESEQEYSYVIAIEKGVRVIKLTRVKEDGEYETKTFEFFDGKVTGTKYTCSNNVCTYSSVENPGSSCPNGHGNTIVSAPYEKQFISISGTEYYK